MSIFRLSLILLFALLLAACGSDNEPGPFDVREDAFVVEDRDRERALETLLWQPVDATEDRRFPLVIFSHGLGGTPQDGGWLAEYLASHGFVVAALRFPHTNRDALDNLDIDDILNQPGDVSAVIDAVLQREADMVDSDRIAVIGHSFGGLTSFLATYDSELRDPRIDAAIMLAAAGGDFFESAFYAHSDAPMLLMHGDQDLLIEYESTSARAFERGSGKRVLARFVGGSHVGFGEFPAWGFNPDHMVCWMMRDTLQADESEVQFFNRLQGRDTTGHGIGTPTAPLPCSYDVEPQPAMSTARMHFLSRPLILAFLQDAFSLSAAESLTRYIEAANATHADLQLTAALPNS